MSLSFATQNAALRQKVPSELKNLSYSPDHMIPNFGRSLLWHTTTPFLALTPATALTCASGQPSRPGSLTWRHLTQVGKACVHVPLYYYSIPVLYAR
jgi:hypothetical protein